MEDMTGKAFEPKEHEQLKKDLRNSYTLTEGSPILEWRSDDDPTIKKKLIIRSIAGSSRNGTTHISLEVEPGKVQHYATICQSNSNRSPICCLIFYERVVFRITGPGPVTIFGYEVIKNNKEGLWEGAKDFFGGWMFKKKGKLKEN